MDRAAEILARKAAAVLRAHGFQAFLVGGCVRDRLLGLAPSDFDIATDATPNQVTNLFPGALLVGAHFGVVLVREGEAEVEVATFRTDASYGDGRRPDRVVFETDPARDAARRDFTVNALFEDVETGRIRDFTGGMADLGARVIRAIGDPGRRFAEDHLRLLRAVRFAAQLGFDIEPATMEAMRRARANVRTVAAERVRDELGRILTGPAPRRGFELLSECGLLEHVLPEVAAMQGVQQPPEFHPEGDVWTHTLLMLEMLRAPSLALAWGVLLHDVGKPPTFRVADRIRFDGHVEKGAEMSREILTRLRLPGDVARQVEALVAYHLRFKDVRRMKESTLKRFMRLERFEEHLELHRLDCTGSHRKLENYEFARERFQAMAPEELKPPRLLTGADLIADGYLPGPLFSRLLNMVEDAQLEGRVHTREQALEYVRERYAGL